MLYGAHSGGVDASRTQTLGQPTFQNQLTYPPGFGAPLDMAAGTTAAAAQRLYVVSDGMLAAYEPATSSTAVATYTLPGDAKAVDLSVDGRFVLVTRHMAAISAGQPISNVITVDADTMLWVRDNDTALCAGPGACPIPPDVPMALTVDGSHAFVSDPDNDKLAYLYLDPPRARSVCSYLEKVVRATKDQVLTSPNRKRQMMSRAAVATNLFDLAERAPNEQARKALMIQAADRMDRIREKMDGCCGGDASDGVLTDCYEATPIWNVTGGLLEAMSEDLMTDPTMP